MNEYKNFGAVVLTRYNSSRLPGKALIEIADKPILTYIIERLERVLGRDQIIIATSNESSDDPIAKYANEIGVKLYRGSLNDVAGRFYNAGHSQNWDYAIRINGDNIFADTSLLRKMIELTQKGNFDFVSNVRNRTYPKGMSIEIVRLSWYSSLLQSIKESDCYKEHVTLMIYEKEPKGRYHFQMNTDIPEAAGVQLALDTPEDLERSRRIISNFKHPHYNYNLKEIMEIYAEG